MTVPGARRAFAALWALTAGAVAACACACAPALAAGDTPGEDYVPGQVLVRFDPGTSKAESAAIAEDQGGEVIGRFPNVPRLALIDLPPGLGVEAAEARYGRLPDVSFTQPNVIYHADAEPDDPFFADGSLWGLSNSGQQVPGSGWPPTVVPGGAPDADIDAPEAWDETTGSANVTVGVIDSGITESHEDLQGNLWDNAAETSGNPGVDDDGNGFVDDFHGWDFVENGAWLLLNQGDNTPDDASTHGSHVAGTIGAVGDNNTGITGVDWDVSLMGLKAGSADGALYSTSIINAIGYAAENGVDIVNGSYSGGGNDNPLSAERIAYQDAGSILFVVAAGNEASNNDLAPRYPCAYTLPNILCVAATGPSDTLAGFSNFGNNTVDLAAPGTNTVSTEPVFKAPLFFDDFNSGSLADWTVGGTPANSWFNSPTDTPRLGTGALTDSVGGDYADNENSWIAMTNPVDLSAEDSCRVNVALAHTLSSGDNLWIEATDTSEPTTQADWVSLTGLSPLSGTLAFSRKNYDLDLVGAAGLDNIRIRFRLVTGNGGTADGVHVDDVKIECVDPASPGAYRVKQGTSMAAPHVTGVAALVAAEHPGYSAEQLRNTLLASVDPVPALQCKVVTGGRLNAFAAVTLDTPASAPAPSCPPTVKDPDPPPPPDPPKKKPKKCKKAKAKKGQAAAVARKKCKRKKKR